MGPIFIPQDLNIEHREIHWKPLPQQNRIVSPEICRVLAPLCTEISRVSREFQHLPIEAHRSLAQIQRLSGPVAYGVLKDVP